MWSIITPYLGLLQLSFSVSLARNISMQCLSNTRLILFYFKCLRGQFIFLNKIKNVKDHQRNQKKSETGNPAWGRFHKLFAPNSRPTPNFWEAFLRRRARFAPCPNFERAISMICALRPTFMKSTPGDGQQILKVVKKLLL